MRVGRLTAVLGTALLLCCVPWAAAQDCAVGENCRIDLSDLPSLRVGGDDGVDLLEVLNPSRLVTSIAQQYANISDCPITNGVLVVKGSELSSFAPPRGTVLQAASAASCAAIAPEANATYTVGTFAVGLPNVGLDQASLDKIVKLFPVKAFGVCVAVQPCKGDYLFGFTGASVNFPVAVPPLPPAYGTFALNALTVSKSGSGARIPRAWHSLPLWKYTDRTDYTQLPSEDITGNLLIDASMSVTWSAARNFTVSLSATGQGKMLVKYSNPTRFALQLAVGPTLFLGPLPIDLKLLGAPTANFLFYVEQYASSNFNMYAGFNAITDFGMMVRNLPGELGQVLGAMVSVASPRTQLTFNIHANQDGGGVRLYFEKGAGLTKAFTDILNAIGVDVPEFRQGMGFRMSVSKTGRVSGYVNIGGKDYGTNFCSRNSDCGDGNVCTAGICSIQYGCARSFERTPRSVLDVGVCREGTFDGGALCYTRCPADRPFTPSPVDLYCYESTSTCGCATTAGAASLCSSACRVFGKSLGGCGCNIRKRGVILKRNPAGVVKSCPADRPDRFAEFCYQRCPPGWHAVNSGCVRDSCPPEFPRACSSGQGSWCVKDTKLGCAQLTAAFARCPA